MEHILGSSFEVYSRTFKGVEASEEYNIAGILGGSRCKQGGGVRFSVREMHFCKTENELSINENELSKSENELLGNENGLFKTGNEP